MSDVRSDRFVRVPTTLLEALIQARLNGGQFRVLLWVIRQTYGWNRPLTPFTWYRIAKELGTHRPAIYRAGRALLKAGVLITQGQQISIQPDSGSWSGGLWSSTSVAGTQLSMTDVDVAGEQRLQVPASNASVSGTPQKRSPQATLFRREKDIKDSLKTYATMAPGINRDSRTTADGGN
jgi:phage replication O-like protein O